MHYYYFYLELLLLLSLLLYYNYLEFHIVPHKTKRKKEKDYTTYDLEIVCLTMEI